MGLEKYCPTVKCIHQWDFGGTETRSLSHREDHLRSKAPARSLVAAVTAGSGPWWQTCSGSFMWTSLAEIEGHKGILRSSVSPKPCTYSAGFIGEEAGALPWQCLVLHLACATVQPSPPLACQAVPSPATKSPAANILIAARWGFWFGAHSF